jgi:haloalkane dehalogenase
MNVTPALPDWLDTSIYPFENRYLRIDGHTVHYVDEGTGPVLLLLHGNPSWSFLYRNIIIELSSRFRCIALDYPGFGLSTAGPGYTFKPVEHSRVVERFITELGLTDIRMMVHDWGGPIGLGVAGRRPELFHSLIIGNTWAWPAQDIPTVAMFSRLVGNPLSRWLIRRFNAFVVWLTPAGITHPLTPAEKAAYRGPFPTPQSREPVAIFPHEILASHDYLAQVESGLARLVDKPVLLVWGSADVGFRASERARFEATFPYHRTRILDGAKHLIQECDPHAISEAIRAFEEAPPRRAPSTERDD